MRRSLVRLALLGAALSGLLATCRYDSAGPRHGGPAYLAVQPIVGLGVDLAAFGLTADTIRLVVTRSSADTLRALTFFFDPDSSQIRLAADVTLRALVETLTVHLELRGGGFALFAGTRALEVRAGRPGPPQQIAVTYTGPGSTIAGLTLAPLDSVLTFGEALRFRVSAQDSSGAPVTGRVWHRGAEAGALPPLGTAAGGRGSAARVRAPPATSSPAAALAGAVSSARSVVTPTATSVLSGAIATLTLHAKDAFGNALTTGGSTVSFNVTGGTSTGTIGPAVDQGDGTYTAPFTGVLAGTPLTIGATIDGSPVMSSPLPTIAVLAGAVAQVLVAPATAALAALGQTQQFAAVAQDANGNVVPGQAFTWTSDNPLVGRVDAGGIVTAVANGSATITATAAGVAGRATLTVAQVVTAVVVSPPTATLAILGTQQFTAIAQDANGNPVPGQTFTWASSQPLIASVDLNGLVTALLVGTAVITATTGGVSGAANLSVF